MSASQIQKKIEDLLELESIIDEAKAEADALGTLAENPAQGSFLNMLVFCPVFPEVICL